MEEKKDIEVVSGDGSNLDISPVYEHLSAGKPTPSDKKPTNIVVPRETVKDSNKSKEEYSEIDSNSNDSTQQSSKENNPKN